MKIILSFIIAIALIISFGYIAIKILIFLFKLIFGLVSAFFATLLLFFVGGFVLIIFALIGLVIFNFIMSFL